MGCGLSACHPDLIGEKRSRSPRWHHAELTFSPISALLHLTKYDPTADCVQGGLHNSIFDDRTTGHSVIFQFCRLWAAQTATGPSTLRNALLLCCFIIASANSVKYQEYNLLDMSVLVRRRIDHVTGTRVPPKQNQFTLPKRSNPQLSGASARRFLLAWLTCGSISARGSTCRMGLCRATSSLRCYDCLRRRGSGGWNVTSGERKGLTPDGCLISAYSNTLSVM
jgi:hypothetical protein